MAAVIELLKRAPQLHPLTRTEFQEVLEKLADFHSRAYQWQPRVTVAELEKITQSGGYLLRTKIRAAIEYLDQMYQYGECHGTEVSQLTAESYGEEVPSLAVLQEE